MQDPIHTATLLQLPPFVLLKEFKHFFHFQEMQKKIFRTRKHKTAQGWRWRSCRLASEAKGSAGHHQAIV
jgi:hypothetical protein